MDAVRAHDHALGQTRMTFNHGISSTYEHTQASLYWLGAAYPNRPGVREQMS